ncbi:MAG: alanine racemase [Vampirovibrionales bacterium]|nr:alanine racemase [Vampirovibrionales bacterium]
MKLTRQTASQPRRDAWVEINLDAIEQNTRKIKSLIGPDKKLMAILKADAYGHGAVMCLPTLEASGVSMVGVASVDEALQIRQAGIELPILVIGMVPDWSMRMAAERDIQITVFDRERLEVLKWIYQESGQPVKVQVKVDTGMHRIGVDWREAADFIRFCQDAPYVSLQGVFSHLAATSDADTTHLQLERWHTVLKQIEPDLPGDIHIANSAGTLHYPEAQGNMVRVGMAFFGYDDLLAAKAQNNPLKPAMSVKARIIHLQEVPEGDGISYGPSFRVSAGKPLRIATLPLGYADGVPRRLSNRISGLLRGHTIRQVGTITMDQMMFDVSDLPEDAPATIGETITLIGSEFSDTTGAEQTQPRQIITLSDWAQKADTIEYELMCQLRIRLPKTYTR